MCHRSIHDTRYARIAETRNSKLLNSSMIVYYCGSALCVAAFFSICYIKFVESMERANNEGISRFTSRVDGW